MLNHVNSLLRNERDNFAMIILSLFLQHFKRDVYLRFALKTTTQLLLHQLHIERLRLLFQILLFFILFTAALVDFMVPQRGPKDVKK